MNRILRVTKQLCLLALGYVVILAGTYIYCELAEPPGIRVDQAAKPLLSPQERAALHPDTRAGLEAYDAGDYPRAHALWLPRAEAGDAEAMLGMGRIYSHGRGVKQDRANARKWYQLGAALRHPWSIHSFAYYLSNGFGGDQNQVAAFNLYKSAAGMGVRASAYNLGQAYRDGKGVGLDRAASFHWYSIAAMDCHPWALAQVGGAYFDGVGVMKNVKHSYMLTVMALLNGDADRWKIHLLYLIYMPPWDYVWARKAAWTNQTATCAQAKPTDLEP